MSKHQMIINYVPGEECRVAIVEDGKLEELYAERFSAASRVGNIYVGRVNNVEASIQAAFVDFGVEDNGFLHISDLHPRYFPGEDDNATEQVGHKTPRRERPLIQHALRKGDEVIVQVLKEGVGTKGPTLTSYLSIPGRFLVMMPQMDKVGVSRKVEDEETRRAMREILDQLELPEGFGFILRTAGMDRSKLELKRDLAYLQRLWKDMEKRRKTGSKPRLMYSESDLLVRCLRDVLTNDMDEVIIDNEQALVRGERFMKIVAPRTKTKLAHYPGKTPIFHAYGIERQISLIHAREVPLPSGGRLVIDQTEALVAIDVNSGRSRDARDAEDNAYKTNIEAVDEICRQLRLRDLGGIVVNDLIDMRSAAHRKDIENRFRERLKRDRAKSTVAPISPFGILEMTRQRMRGSHEQLHFSDCPICRGRGLVQKPDSVAGEALRELAAYLDYERISKVELVVSPRVAGELLSNKRRLLGRIERESGKHVEMRVSEDIPPDRVSFYAYELDGADVDLERLPPPRRPENLKVWEFDPPVEGEDVWSGDPLSERQQALAAEAQADDALDKADSDLEPHPIEIDEPDSATGDVALDAEENGKRRRRRRRRGRGGRPDDRGPAPQSAPATSVRPATPTPELNTAAPDPNDPAQPADAQSSEIGEDGVKRRRRRRRRGRGGRGAADAPPLGDTPGAPGRPQQAPPRPDRRDPHYESGESAPGIIVPPVGPIPRREQDITPHTVVETMGDWGDDDAPAPAHTPVHTPAHASAQARTPARQPAPPNHAPRHSARPSIPAPIDASNLEADQGPDGEDDQGDGAPQSQDPAGPPEEGSVGDAGRRRRRRRRRGRGGRGVDAQPGAPVDGQPAPAAIAPPPRPAPPPNERRNEPRGPAPAAGDHKPRRDDRRPRPDGAKEAPRREPRPASKAPHAPAPASKPAAPPASPAPGTPPPVRPLYFNRRKLTPAEMNKRPKPE